MESKLSTANSLNIRLVSETMVRPAADTKEGTLFLTNIDHLLMFYAQTIYVYPHVSEAESKDVIEILRNALAKVLVPFNFMAGRLRMNDDEERLEVHCNRAGVLFSHAETEIIIADMGTLDFLNPLLPRLTADLQLTDQLSDCPLMILKVTKFRCGGFIVGLSIIHALLDGQSGDIFMNQFASISRGDGLTALPYLNKEALRARDPPRPIYEHPEFMKASVLQAFMANSDPNDLTSPQALWPLSKNQWKSFSFCTKFINYLQSKALEDESLVKKCSKFDVLAAYLWQARTKALDMSPNQVSQLMFAVDFRQRFNPPLPKELIGNAVATSCIRTSANKIINSPLSFCVKQIQDAKGKITEAYVRSTIDWLQLNKGSILSASGGIIISSWSRFITSRMNLGWGAPAYSGPVFHGEQLKNFVILLPKKQQEESIFHVYLALEEHQMDKFTQIYQTSCEMAELDRNVCMQCRL
ncbi:hypothetical protein O6H91_19G083900 [Diphasiastrum complanatum]|uniref:Uncharacterized protein n=2 Tax=Diphasiastrum complanatum TaxID=34168 RepID=A0ACC2AX90_DIPCM|nr:hypothetical protein O6H91_19G083500 [Diphasiastrum complanatum]KAJ7522111.1 hypothetical protein O6H91_19G083900 [Diphasiastrum complanatum]